MPVVPTAEESEQIRWECSHCKHTWMGKPKATRADSGNPTCSSCGKRSGSHAKEEQIDEDENSDTTNVLVELALKTAFERLHNENRRVM